MFSCDIFIYKIKKVREHFFIYNFWLGTNVVIRKWAVSLVEIKFEIWLTIQKITLWKRLLVESETLTVVSRKV